MFHGGEIVTPNNQWVDRLCERYDAILFDVGNTLVEQSLPGTPLDEVKVIVLRGVVATVSALDGRIAMGLVSNTSEMGAASIRSFLDSVDLGSPFPVIVATAELGIHKPDPAPLVEAARQLGVDPARCLYVGDVETDLLAATRAGMNFCFSGPDLEWILSRYACCIASPFDRARASQRGIDMEFARQCETEINLLAKPPGSLGDLELAAMRIASIQRRTGPRIDPVAAAVFVADHGIAESDVVTPWPWTITKDIAKLMADGKAAGSVFARSSDVFLEIVNVGIATGDSPEGVRDEVVRRGTFDIRSGRTMSPDDVLAALDVGANTASRLIAGGSRVLCVGEVGIGNTTSAAALISWCTGLHPFIATGVGSGIPEDAHERKRQIVADAVESLGGNLDALEILERIGGLEIAAMVGFMTEAASVGVPVILDGVITLSAACIAEKLCPQISTSMIASHQSPEPATVAALEFLNLQPLINLGMRVGEGTGALAVVPLLRSMCNAITEMARLTDL
jgi:nicotinate-nucleotide--dimethylbenzimidazole phosphoribosyltransferase